VVVEVDGALHLDQRNWWSDQSRQNKLVLADAVVLRYPSVVIRTQPQLVAAEIREALRVP
jgi:very-short-patch-repair endonuclease